MQNNIFPENWVREYGNYLFSLAVMKLGDKEMAKDLLQETFFSAYKNRNQFRGEASEKTWLTTILNNKIKDYYRSIKTRPRFIDYLDKTEAAFQNYYYSSEPHHYGHVRDEVWVSAETSDKVVRRKEVAKALRDCISLLPAFMIPVFQAKYMDEKKADEICKEYSITASNYWVIIHRAKVLLQDCLRRKA
jgi:RNA polymerase sigma-70 factor (TIGR02943 family)